MAAEVRLHLGQAGYVCGQADKVHRGMYIAVLSVSRYFHSSLEGSKIPPLPIIHDV